MDRRKLLIFLDFPGYNKYVTLFVNYDLPTPIWGRPMLAVESVLLAILSGVGSVVVKHFLYDKRRQPKLRREVDTEP